MSLRKYSTYQDSGIEWLGEVPEHWDVCSMRHSLKNLFNGLTADQIHESDMTVPVTRIETISSGHIDTKRLGFVDRFYARDDRKLLCGDILFSNINSLNMIGNCAIYSGGIDIYAGMNLLVLRPNSSVFPKWMYWLLRSSVLRSEVESLAKPAINQASISQASVSSIVIARPSFAEQKTIAAYLDRETAKINDLVAEKERLIELLKEKRQALISHAVTKGLDPNVPMKNSDVEWLGEVPMHWDIKPLKYIASCNDTVWDENTDPTQEILYVDISSVDEISGITTKMPMIFAEAPSRARRRVSHGDIIVSTVRTYLRAIARIMKPEENLTVSTGFAVIRPLKSVIPDFLGCALFADVFLGKVIARSNGVSYPAINADDLMQIPICLPPVTEQRNIAVYLGHETSKIDLLVAEANKAITLLQEKRFALISAVVTGKVDVRHLVEVS